MIPDWLFAVLLICAVLPLLSMFVGPCLGCCIFFLLWMSGDL